MASVYFFDTKMPDPAERESVMLELEQHDITFDFELERECELTLTHELHPDWADYVDRTEAAWTQMLDVIAEMLR